MKLKYLLIAACTLPLVIFTLSCDSDSGLLNNNPGDNDDDDPPATTGRYIHWERFVMSTDNAFPRSATLVIDGKIYSNPYSYSTDGGITWTTDPSDGLGRQFRNMNGDFWVEISILENNTKKYEALNGAGTRTVNNPYYGEEAWDGGSKMYTIANNAGMTFGGHWQEDFILETTDGINWEPIPFQPPHEGQQGSLTGVRLIDGKLFVTGFTTNPPDNTQYHQLYVSNGASWISSAVYTSGIGVRKVAGHGLFASVSGGTYRMVFNGPTFSFQELDIEDDFNNSTNTTGLLLNAGGNLLLATGFKLFIPHPTTGRLYNPSPMEGPNSLPGIGGIVQLDNELIVTRGWYTYKTPFPFVFHENP